MVVRLSISVLVVVFVGIALISAGRAFITESNDTLNTISSLDEDKELRPNTAKDGNTLSFHPQHKTRSQNYQSKGFRPSKSISSSSRGQNSHPQSSRHVEFTHQKREKQRASEGHRSSSPGQPSQKGHQSWIGNITCDACKVLVGSIQKLMTEQKTTDDIIKAAIEICKLYKIESSRVCDLIVPQYSEMFLGVVRWTVLNPDEICGYALGDSCAVPYDPVGLWNITISDKPKPPLTPRVLPKPGSPTLRVLHLTDIHLDVEYRPGADADCGEPLCCRAYDLDPAPTRSSQAGRWGDYRNCDMPADTLELLFQHLSAIQDQFDYVIFTGDIAAHDVWNQTRSDQLTNLLRLTKLFRTYLPDKPVFPCPGNHEGVPCDSFPPDTVKGQSMEWLYSAYLEAWGYWLPSSVAQTIMRGGFYTFSPFPGFRIISLNANYGASSNWWLLLNGTDPQGQLQWLADVLQESEDKEEKVHILSHFPPGHQLKAFAWNYYRLINRYESTVVGQFHGHTHKDEYEVFYDLHNTSRALGVSYVGGSVTLYSYTNPGYRIYTIDGNYTDSSWEILDYSHYYLDIARANTAGKATPTWSKEYSVKETYKMPSLFPEDWNNLIYRMKANDTLFQQYYSFYHKSAETAHCDSRCKQNMLCHLKTAMPSDPDFCKDIFNSTNVDAL
ncbi:sphingomyelin phosphodiesterase-like [Littorina saxatilis]|uniref:Sphingomyelin phosphodiesterase n=1 Tax=Littorina saxatilis TaxID=31220 RepID=A0AAN9AHZ1_9CAEN